MRYVYTYIHIPIHYPHAQMRHEPFRHRYIVYSMGRIRAVIGSAEG